MTLKKCIRILMILGNMLCLIFSQTIFPQNKNATIYLEADNITYDYKKNIIYYNGHVHANADQTELIADKMIVYYNSTHQIEKITAMGKLAQYKTLMNEDKNTLKASANIINYYPLKHKVYLEENATVSLNQNLFSGPFIYYDIAHKVISSHPHKKSRSKIVLEAIRQLKTELQ